MTYELYYNGQLASSTLAAQLEARLAALETAIGEVPYEEVRAAHPGRRAHRAPPIAPRSPRRCPGPRAPIASRPRHRAHHAALIGPGLRVLTRAPPCACLTLISPQLGVTNLSAALSALTSRVALLDPKRLEVLGLRIKAINADLERQAALRQQQPAVAAEVDQKVACAAI